MAVTNTFTDVIDRIFGRSLVALAETAVMPGLVNTDFSAEVAAQGDTVDVIVGSDAIVEDVVPGAVPPAGGDTAPTKVPVPLNYWKKTSMHVTDKEAREVASGAKDIQLSYHMRALGNEVDSRILSLYPAVYGFAGNAGTTPFASDLSAATAAGKVLNDQLAFPERRNIVLGSAAIANAQLLRPIQDATFRANTENTLRNGRIGTLLGFDWAMDQLVPTHTTGAAGSPLLDASTARAVGIKSLHMDGLTTKPSVGDIFTIAGDTQTYTVTAATDLAGTDSDISFEPGLKVAIPAVDGNEVVTFKASHVVNWAFQREAIALAVRPLGAADGFTGGNIIRTAIEPRTGLAITLEVSREHNRTKYQWSILYGVKLVRPQLACRIAG